MAPQAKAHLSDHRIIPFDTGELLQQDAKVLDHKRHTGTQSGDPSFQNWNNESLGKHRS